MNLLALFSESFGEDEAVVRTIGNSLFVRYAGDPAVLKITTEPGATYEVKVTLQVIHPEHGPIDTTSFTHTRSQNGTAALERLAAYSDIWFA
ncbi:hypothetical protein GCM10014715_39120 [Streptomyces spiralis]|uniref:Uncharacterized protein n=1 Tax=Streptomyces spiralis TaxID=66376 RepID=A0A919DUE1_9ACTN|nr:hypothetical protein [Streptomyces spiralis]GHE79944.1 hypothetical protein GCM10014715_39120 [Streptomyces spiralis]